MPIKRSQKVDVLKNLRGTLSVGAGECSRLRTTAPPIPSHPFRPRWHFPGLRVATSVVALARTQRRPPAQPHRGRRPPRRSAHHRQTRCPNGPPHGSPRRTTRREPRPSAAPPRCSTAESPCTPSLYPTITLYSGCTAGTDPAPATEPTGPVRTREATSAGARCRDSAGHRREFLAEPAKVRGERPGFHGCRPSAARR